ncbi:HAMP domain-containing histidine kinase [archaeon]|nr:HAMP domain-containing histidine kinase [archaeon]
MENPKRWPAIITFIALQVAWLAVVVIWVIWYIKYNAVRINPIGVWDIVVITEISVLFLLILAGIYILFILYQRQLTLMRTQMHIISSITHAFKTPLATIQLYLETIRKRDLGDETKNMLLTGMMGENQRLKSLVDNFLASARLSYSRRPYVFSRSSISDFLNEFLAKHEIHLKDITMHTYVPEDMMISVDKEALDLVFSNLAENAIHYSTSRPEVEIEVWREKKWACVRFSDTGIGIPKEQQRDVFNIFHRLPESKSMWGSGTGMGLYVVKMIIKAHGGTIKVSAGKNNIGTSFLIRIPCLKI